MEVHQPRQTNRSWKIISDKHRVHHRPRVVTRFSKVSSSFNRTGHGLNFCRKTQLEFELSFISATAFEDLIEICGNFRSCFTWISLLGVYVWCQKINFGDLKSGITQSSSDVKEFHLLLLSPFESKCKFHRSVVPPSGRARCVSSASLLVRTARRRKFPLKRRIIFDVKGIHTSSGRLRKVVLLMLLPYRLSPRERNLWKISPSRGKWEIVESNESVHDKSAIISKGRERLSLSRAARERSGKPFSATPASPSISNGESSKVLSEKLSV